MNDSQVAEQQRTKWRKYFEQALNGSEGEIGAATDGAMAAIARQADQAGVIAAGQAAAAQYRAGGRPTAPPMVDPRRVATAPPAAGAAPQQAAYHSVQSAPRPVGDSRSGVVTGLQQRQEMVRRTYWQVWNFRLERRDATGTVLPPVPVEVRARSFRGQIANGDLLEIPSRAKPRQLRNLTTGVTVKARGKPHPVANGFAVTIGLLVFAIVMIYVLSSGIS
jgi:hypothetical protein